MMFPAVVYALWGTSRQAGVGPQSIPALLIGSAVSCKTALSFLLRRMSLMKFCWQH
jgi:MFS superfamily sulfate permease-like transporter